MGAAREALGGVPQRMDDDRPAPPDGAASKRAIQQGDPDGLRTFVEAYGRPLYAFCFHRLDRDHHATEEAVQETLLLALERIDDYDPARGEMHAWLAFLSRNVMRRLRRQKGPFVELALEDEPFLDDEEAVFRGDAPIDARAEAALVDVALARLPARQRSVLERKYLGGDSVRAIAAADGASEKAIESLLVRAREAFRAAFLEAARLARAVKKEQPT